MNENTDEIEEHQDLFEHWKFIVDKGQSLLRIDKFLASRIENISRNKIKNAAEAGCILVNNFPVKPNYKVKPEDLISIVLAYPPREIEVIPQDLPINIIYEDCDLAVINKDAGMVVHPGCGNHTGTLVNALAFHFKELPLFKSGEFRPGLVHRIDKDTSGLLVVAKNEVSLNNLAYQFYKRTIERKYIALAWGNFDKQEDTVNGHIGRSLNNRKKMSVFPDGNYGKHATTHFKVIEDIGYVSLVECKLETGRTHQIRAHFEYIKHPLFNDEKYGGSNILKGTISSNYKAFVDNCFKIMQRHALHAKSLGFFHPSTGKKMEFDSEIPPDMAEVIEKWRNFISNRGT
jgi:23S rRNA pseudouridine1911/1915/1917 synthase